MHFALSRVLVLTRTGNVPKQVTWTQNPLSMFCTELRNTVILKTVRCFYKSECSRPGNLKYSEIKQLHEEKGQKRSLAGIELVTADEPRFSQAP